MSNTIFIDAALQRLTSPGLTSSTKNTAARQSYLDILKALQKTATSPTKEKDASGMTMEEYQTYIGEKLQTLVTDTSRRQSSTAVIISDAGWQQMKEDPSYESWVIQTVANDLASSDPWSTVGSGSYTIHRFGASQNAYSYDSWGKDYPGDIKSYLISELFDFDITGNRSSSSNFWLKLAQKKLQAQNRQAILELASGISQTQSLKMATSLMQTTAFSSLANLSK